MDLYLRSFSPGRNQSHKLIKKKNGDYILETADSKIEVIRSQLIEVIDPDVWCNNLDLKIETGRDVNIDRDELLIGENYVKKRYKGSLRPNRLYRLKKIVEIDGDKKLVLEYLEGDELTGLTLDEDSCKHLGVEFIPDRLIVDSALQEWKRTNKNKTWFGVDPDDLSTYPESMTEGYQGALRYMMIRIHGFGAFPDWRTIKLPGGGCLDVDVFLNSLSVKVICNIAAFGGFKRLSKGTILEWTPILDFGNRQSQNHLVDEEGNLYLVLKFESGVSCSGLIGKNIQDLIEVSYDATFSSSMADSIRVSEKKIKHIPVHDGLYEIRNGRPWRKVLEDEYAW